MLRKLHVAGLVGAITTLGGLLALPEVANLFPGHEHWAPAIIAIGAAIQAVTRAVYKGDVVEVPK